MLTYANERFGTPGQDGLIYDLNPPAEVFAVKIAGGQGTLKRGSVLSAGTDGSMTLMASGGTANCILAVDVATGDAADTGEGGDTGTTTQATDTEAIDALAYRSGHFAENMLIVADGYTLTAADKEALRDVGILLSDAMEY